MRMMIIMDDDDDTVHCTTVRTDSIMIRSSRSYMWPAKWERKGRWGWSLMMMMMMAVVVVDLLSHHTSPHHHRLDSSSSSIMILWALAYLPSPIYQSINLSIYLPIYISIYLSIYLPVARLNTWIRSSAADSGVVVTLFCSRLVSDPHRPGRGTAASSSTAEEEPSSRSDKCSLPSFLDTKDRLRDR